jgi:hypothetical protein
VIAFDGIRRVRVGQSSRLRHSKADVSRAGRCPNSEIPAA